MSRLAQRSGGRGRFLDEGGIVLRGRIHVGDRRADVAHLRTRAPQRSPLANAR